MRLANCEADIPSLLGRQRHSVRSEPSTCSVRFLLPSAVSQADGQAARARRPSVQHAAVLGPRDTSARPSPRSRSACLPASMSPVTTYTHIHSLI